MYCVGLYSRFNKLEIDWEILRGNASDAYPRAIAFPTEEEIKNRLDHREIDSRDISLCVCQLLSDNNNKL